MGYEVRVFLTIICISFAVEPSRGELDIYLQVFVMWAYFWFKYLNDKVFQGNLHNIHLPHLRMKQSLPLRSTGTRSRWERPIHVSVI